MEQNILEEEITILDNKVKQTHKNMIDYNIVKTLSKSYTRRM